MTPRPYVDRPIADGVAAARVAAEAATSWGLPEPELLRIGMNAIFRAGDVVLRVSSPTASALVSIQLADTLDAAGVPVARAIESEPFERSGLSVTAWPFLAASDEPIDWNLVGEQVRRVHELSPDLLPVGLPTPSPTDFGWWDFERLLGDVDARLDDAARAGLVDAIQRHEGWRRFDAGDVVVCHGDVHPGNVIQTADGPVLIDWDLLCLAPPGWDHSALMRWTERWGGDPGVYESFADGYGVSMIDDRWAPAFAELRLAAATLMRVRASFHDEAAWAEADRRLAYWRADERAPMWRAV